MNDLKIDDAMDNSVMENTIDGEEEQGYERSEEFEKLFEIFKVECEEHIQKLNAGILDLEENSEQPELMDEIFRAAHSVKGSARMINIPSIENIAHQMETILGKIRKNEMTLSTDISSLIFQGLDAISQVVEAISQGGWEDEVDSSSLLKELSEISEEETQIQEKSEETSTGAKIQSGSYDEEKNERSARDINLFSQETGDSYQKLINSLLCIEKEPHDEKEIENAFHQAHALKGSARIVKHTEMGDISFSIERALSKIQDTKTKITSSLINTLLEGTDIIEIFIRQVEEGETKTIPSDFKKVISNIDSLTAQPDASKIPPGTKKPAKPVKGKGKSKDLLVSSQAKSVVRVSSEKLDGIMEQAGELLTMKLKAQERLAEIQSLIDKCNALSREMKKIKRIEGVKPQKNNLLKSKAGIADFKEREKSISFVSDRLETLHKFISDDSRQLGIIVKKLQDDIKKTRLLPFHTIMNVFPRMVRDLSITQKKKIKFEIIGSDIELDKNILEEIKDPLMHIFRNCIDHGIELPEEREKIGKPEEGTLRIEVSHKGNNAVIEIKEDGRGIDTERIKTSAIKKGLYSEKEIRQMQEKQIVNLIFHPGFSTSEIITDVSGRGVGMDVVKYNIERMNGAVDIETEKNKGTKFILTIPLTIGTTKALKIVSGDNVFFLPVNMVERILKAVENELPTIEKSLSIHYENSFVPYVRLTSILEMSDSTSTQDSDMEKPVIIVRSGGNLAAFGIDRFLGEEDILIKGLGVFMKRVRNVSGATIMSNGNIAPILNVQDMINTAQIRGIASVKRKITGGETKEKLSILIVDDSIMTRTMEKNILESYGYRIVTAVDGQDALSKLQDDDFDVIVSDIQMPNMGGLEFTEKIKKDNRFSGIPVILVTALESDEDKKRGIQVGADAYIVKSSFDQSNLLKTIERLI